MAVTDDRYELPVYVEDTIAELARKLHMNRSSVKRHLQGKTQNFRYLDYKLVEVEVDDDGLE